MLLLYTVPSLNNYLLVLATVQTIQVITKLPLQRQGPGSYQHTVPPALQNFRQCLGHFSWGYRRSNALCHLNHSYFPCFNRECLVLFVMCLRCLAVAEQQLLRSIHNIFHCFDWTELWNHPTVSYSLSVCIMKTQEYTADLDISFWSARIQFVHVHVEI